MINFFKNEITYFALFGKHVSCWEIKENTNESFASIENNHLPTKEFVLHYNNKKIETKKIKEIIFEESKYLIIMGKFNSLMIRAQDLWNYFIKLKPINTKEEKNNLDLLKDYYITNEFQVKSNQYSYFISETNIFQVKLDMFSPIEIHDYEQISEICNIYIIRNLVLSFNYKGDIIIYDTEKEGVISKSNIYELFSDSELKSDYVTNVLFSSERKCFYFTLLKGKIVEIEYLTKEENLVNNSTNFKSNINSMIIDEDKEEKEEKDEDQQEEEQKILKLKNIFDLKEQLQIYSAELVYSKQSIYLGTSNGLFKLCLFINKFSKIADYENIYSIYFFEKYQTLVFGDVSCEIKFFNFITNKIDHIDSNFPFSISIKKINDESFYSLSKLGKVTIFNNGKKEINLINS